MRLHLTALAATACLIAGGAMAQTVTAGGSSGGSNATGGSIAQTNTPAPASSTSAAPKPAKKTMKHKMAPKASGASGGSAAGDVQPNGTGGATTPSGR